MEVKATTLDPPTVYEQRGNPGKQVGSGLELCYYIFIYSISSNEVV